ncbi:MAG: serine/threonine-protein kinase, partial [Marmoricola sp.]
RILRRADADHVVRVYDNGETESGTPYFVMSYADRGTVADLIALGRPSIEQSLDIIRQAGAGLAVLHSHGIIHRDIKPQNLLLRSRPDGGTEVLVADLGVAKAVAHASGLTQVVGTPAYIAPEQALGQGLDIRADVHALGAVAYVLLTGRLVREDGIASLVAARLPPAPSQVAEVPRRLDAPILKALAIDPAQRWPDIESFLAGLAAAQVETAEAPPRRKVPLVALVLLVLLVTFAASYVVTALLR